MSEDSSDALVVTLRYAGGRGQRLEIEPGSEDPRADHTLHERTLTKGGEWKAAGAENVTAIDVEGVVDATPARAHLQTALEVAEEDAARYHLRQALQLLDAVEVSP